MSYWLKFLLLGLGLAGLWMVHTLAQDFNIIQSNNKENNEGSGRDLFKRSISENRIPQINWEMVLSRDPASCARSFLCQLAATEERFLSKEEHLILGLVRYSARQENLASKQLQEALKSGEKVVKPSQCMKIYKYCPYTSQMMMTLLRVFGR